jgi:chemotaxis protein CheZ
MLVATPATTTPAGTSATAPGTPAFPAPLTNPALSLAIRAELAPVFQELHRFIDRRVSELSAELHGTAQLLGFSETNLSGQLGHLHEQLARMIARPAEATRNSGVELEAVVQTTEAAANQIMEAAEAISDCVRAAMPDKTALAAISAKIDAIFEACAFQDLTGQRVRRAIQQLHSVDSALSGLLAAAPAEPPPATAPQPDLPQGDIDALFAA